MKRLTRPKYRKQHTRMVVRARWHRLISGGAFPSAAAAFTAFVLALLVQVLELQYWSAMCAKPGIMQPLCEIPLDMSVSLQAGVGLGVLGSVGIVFSILLVSLQLISGQFSPRLVQAVFRDKRSKSLIAILVGVFVFSMSSLFTTIVLAGQGEASGLNTVLVGIAGIIAGVSLVIMLYGVAQQQYIGSILDEAARDTISILETNAGTSRVQRHQSVGIPHSVLTDISTFPEELGDVHVVLSRRSGWVQQLTSEALLHVAPQDCLIRLETRVGAFIPKGAPLASVWPIVDRDGRGDLTDVEKQRLDIDVNLTTYVGTSRTMQDDADFGLRQITDVFLRAMSPAVNDPSTAIEALMRTTTVLRTIITNQLPDQIHHEPTSGVTILRPWDLDSEEYMRHGLDQIRLAAVDQPATAIAVLRVITHLIETAELELTAAEGIEDDLDRRARLHHLELALRDLRSQREATLDAVREAGYPKRDLDYVLRGIETQRPDLLGDYPPQSLLDPVQAAMAVAR